MKPGDLGMRDRPVLHVPEPVVANADLVRRQRLAPLRVYVDSPMATAATHITLKHPELVDSHTRDLIDWMCQHPKKMSVEFVADVERSRAE